MEKHSIQSTGLVGTERRKWVRELLADDAKIAGDQNIIAAYRRQDPILVFTI